MTRSLFRVIHYTGVASGLKPDPQPFYFEAQPRASPRARPRPSSGDRNPGSAGISIRIHSFAGLAKSPQRYRLRLFSRSGIARFLRAPQRNFARENSSLDAHEVRARASVPVVEYSPTIRGVEPR